MSKNHFIRISMFASMLCIIGGSLIAQKFRTDDSKPYTVNGSTLVKWTGSEDEIDFSKYPDLNMITTIGDSAFINNTHLRSIKIPKNINVIGRSAFSGCTSLTDFSISTEYRYVTLQLRDSALLNCTALKKVDLSQAENIGAYALSGCSSLDSITVKYSGSYRAIYHENSFAGMNPNLKSFNLKISKYNVDDLTNIKNLFGSSVYNDAVVSTPEIASYRALGKCESFLNAFPKFKNDMENLTFVVKQGYDNDKVVKSMSLMDKTTNKEITDWNKVPVKHKIEVNIEVKDGYVFKKATIKDLDAYKIILDTTANKFVFVMPNGDVSIKVMANPILTYAVKDDSKSFGSLSAIFSYSEGYWGTDKTETPIASGEGYDGDKSGAEFKFTATPKEGYRVKAWYVNGEVQENEFNNVFTYKATGEKLDVQVEFEKGNVQQLFTTTGSNYTAVFTNKTTGQAVQPKERIDVGSVIHAVVTPKENYSFVEAKLRNVAKEYKADTIYKSAEFEFTITNDRYELYIAIEPNVVFGAKDNVGGKVTALYRFQQYGEEPIDTALVSNKPLPDFDGYAYDEYIMYTATADPGYKLKNWIVDGEETPLSEDTPNQYKQTRVSQVDPMVTYAVFEKTKAPLTFSVDGENGSISAKGAENATINSGDSVLFATAVTFTAAPANDFAVKAWLVNDKVVDGQTDNTFVYTMGADSANVKVQFEAVKTYEISQPAFNHTSVDTILLKDITTGLAIEDWTKISFNHQIQCTIKLKDGYVFKSAKGQDADNFYNFNKAFETTESNFVFTMPAFNVRIIVYANPILTFGVKAGSEAYGSLSAVFSYSEDLFGDGDVIEKPIKSGEDYDNTKSNSKLKFTAIPNEGYHVKAWYVNGELKQNETENTLVIRASEDKTDVQVEFVKSTSRLTYEVEGRANGSVKATFGNLRIRSPYDLEVGSVVNLTATPDNGYRVKAWKVNGQVVEGAIGNTFTYTMTNEDALVQVQLEKITSVLTFETVDNHGTIDAKDLNNVKLQSPVTLNYNTYVKFFAQPAEGYQVKEWTVNEVVKARATNTLEYTVKDKDVIVKVSFEPIPKKKFVVEATSSSDELGSVEIKNAATQQTITSATEVEEGTELIFTAKPAQNVDFKGWIINGDKVAPEAANPTVLHKVLTEATVKEGKLVVQAIFTKKPRALNHIDGNNIIVRGMEHKAQIEAPVKTVVLVYNLNGKLVDRFVMTTDVMNRELPSGYYIVKIGSQSFKVNVK